MSKAGWYPDPGGQQGMFRWWDGAQWTPSLTANPYSPPPASTEELRIREAQPTGAPGYAIDYSQLGQQRSGRGPALALGLIGLLVVALIVGGVALVSGRLPGLFGGGEGPASNPTADVCPKRSQIVESTAPQVHPPGRVQGGKLSYPVLGAPWGPVQPETRVPFGRDVYGQSVMLEENYDGRGASWVGSLVVGELVAGDGFFSPQQGSEIVTRCILGVFYGDAEVHAVERVNQATTVGGKEAWLVEMHLGFDIPGLKEKGETAIVLIVATGAEASSIYYASIPDSRPDLLATAREVQGQLRIEP